MKNKIKMKLIVPITIVLLFALMLIFGCSIAQYPTGDISKNPSLAHFDVNNLPFDVKKEYQQDKGITIITVVPKFEPGANKTFSMKYHHSLIYSAPNVHIPVEFPNGRKYIAYLDTGLPFYVFLTSDIILDYKLSIWPMDPNDTFKGLCHIPVLNIGPARIKDAAGYYWEQQWQFRILNIPVYKHSAIILGVKFIKSFDYVLFDNVGREVVFSKDGAFEPDNPQVWMSFPFSIKPDSFENERIMVQIPVNGYVCELFFDSCGDKPGLRLNKSHWQAVEPKLSVKRLKKTHIYNFQAGRVAVQKAAVSQISIGDKILKNAEIVISEDPNSLSKFSLDYFQDTVVVLDFVNRRMWIKK